MKRLIVLLMVVPLSLWLAHASDHKGMHGSNVTMNNDASSDDCADHLHGNNDDFRSSVRGEETRNVPNQPLSIVGEHNGGIQVTTWDQPEFSLKLCKEVAANDESQARNLLADLHLEVGSGQVTVRSPQHVDDDYSLSTVLLVKAPRNATLDLSVHNGGVSLNRFSGTASAHAQNGGISIKNSSGKLTAVAQNGGVSIKDSSGEINADVQNGGIVLALPERWDGKGLEAHTRNGGLVVAVPRNFQTGLEIVGSNHTSIICKSDACGGAQRTWDNDGHKILRLGDTTPQIRATTINGGVVVEQREHARGEL